MKTSPKSIYDLRYQRLIAELVEIRKNKELSQRDLAKLAKVSNCFIGRVETRERRLDLIEFIDLCKVLGLKKHDIIKIIEKLI